MHKMFKSSPIITAALAVALALISANTAVAGWFICNDAGVEVSVAYAWSNENGWNSRGWRNIKPRDCALVLEGPLENRIYYYYAEGSGLTWENRQNTAYFCTKTDKFFYTYKGNPSCTGYNFREVDVGEDRVWTTRLTENATNPADAALNCQSELQNGRDAFVRCWTRQVATTQQRKILDCIQNTDTPASLALCAARGYVSNDARRFADCSIKYHEDRKPIGFVKCINNGVLEDKAVYAVNCALRNRDNYAAIASCAVGTELSAQQQRMFDCVAQNTGSYRAIGLCVAGTQLSPEQQRLANCVMNNKGSYVQMGVCAAGNNLTPEQQVFASCAISTGGQPYAFAACVGGQLTINEIDKCFSRGIGEDGCFGRNNTAVKFVSNAWRDVTEGPGPSNDLVGRDGATGKFLENGRRDLEEGPGENNDLVGRCGFVGTALFGGC